MTVAFDLAPPPLGRWRDGNTGTEGVWQFHGAEPGRHTLVSALVHGNELCGAWALLGALEAGLRPNAGTLTLALCNLAAFDDFDAGDPDASRFVDEDMNRVWGPGLRADGPATAERVRARALLPFVEAADWLLDLHSMHETGAPLMLAGLHGRNVDLARRLRTPAQVIVDAGHADGQRMRDHGRFGNAGADGPCSLLIECGYHGALASRNVALDSMARFLVAAGTVAAGEVPPEWWQPLPANQEVLEVTHAVVARSIDFQFAQPWYSGQRVAEHGTLLGWDAGEAIHTPYPDCVLVMPSLRQLRPGVTVMRLARHHGA
jgi:predicted deacylase